MLYLFDKIGRSLLWKLFYRPVGSVFYYYWNKPEIADIYVSLDKLLNSNRSLCRFGNGEFDIIWGKSEGFQSSNSELGVRLRKILHTKNENVYIAITDFYRDNPKLRTHEKTFAYTWRLSNFYKISKLLINGEKFLNTYVSRPYSTYTDVDVSEYIKKFKKLWDSQDLYVIEGRQCRVGVGNDLFDNASHIYRIEAPATNAWNRYDEILAKVKLLIPKGAIIYMALGATATVLAYDLAQLGYRALDLGHLDIEYEYYLHKATGKMKIPGKYVNEVEGGNEVDDSLVDNSYLSSIICRID